MKDVVDFPDLADQAAFTMYTNLIVYQQKLHANVCKTFAVWKELTTNQQLPIFLGKPRKKYLKWEFP